MRERNKQGRLVGTVNTGTDSCLSPLRCAVQRASNRVTWAVGKGQMKLHTRITAVRSVDPHKATDPAFYWRAKKRKVRAPRLVKVSG